MIRTIHQHVLGWAIAVTVLFAHPVKAGGSADNVFLVVNADSWASLTLANDYVAQRGIADSHVLCISDVPALDYIAVGDFRRHILQPVLQTIEERGLSEIIDYIVYSTDFPAGIWVKSEFPWGDMPRHFQDMGAITAMTYLYEATLSGDVRRYATLDNNHYARRPKQWTRDTEWSDDDRAVAQELQTLTVAREQLIRKNKGKDLSTELREYAQKRLPLLEALVDRHPHSAWTQFDYACVLAALDRTEASYSALQRAVDNGWWDAGQTLRERSLKPMHDAPEFKRLLDTMRAPDVEMPPSVPFSHQTAWHADGSTSDTDEGSRYYLSTMLSYTSGAGLSVQEAITTLRQSIAADGSQPEGQIYFARNKNVRSTTREWAISATEAAVAKLGRKMVVVEGILPKDKPDVLGAIIGYARFDWQGCKSDFVPGALAEHLTSTGGTVWRRGGQTKCTEFLRYGAAGSSGTVSEPYAIQAKFPTPWLHVHYLKGYSLAESFYQSVAAPYQLLVLGDPLCQPFARKPTVTITGVNAGDPVETTRIIKPNAKFPSNDGHFQMLVDGVLHDRCSANGTLKLRPAELSPGDHELVVTAIDAGPVRTQGRTRLPFSVPQKGFDMEISALPPTVLQWGKPVTLTVRAKQAKRIVVTHLSRAVSEMHGEIGSMRFDPMKLGLGEVKLTVEAHFADRIARRFITRVVTEMPPLPPLPLPSGHRLEEGFTIQQAGEDPVIVQSITGDRGQFARATLKQLNARTETITSEQAWLDKVAESLPNETEWIESHRGQLDQDYLAADAAIAKLNQERLWNRKAPKWLVEAGIEPGRPFTIDGWFEVPVNDVYQFQVRSNLNIKLSVDGHLLQSDSRTPWRHLPIALKAGLHRLTVSANGDALPLLQIRFGGQGTALLSGAEFKHLVPIE